jgi:hypothetical protein
MRRNGQKKPGEREGEMRVDQKRRQKQKRNAMTLEVLHERRTKVEIQFETVVGKGGFSERAKFQYSVAYWPDQADPAVVRSPEAMAWQAELDAAKTAAKERACSLVARLLEVQRGLWDLQRQHQEIRNRLKLVPVKSPLPALLSGRAIQAARRFRRSKSW